MATHPLDNVIWSALTTRQARLAIGDDRARRYAADMAPFVAIPDGGPEAGRAMAGLATPGEALAMVGVTPRDLAGWTVERASAVSQMVYDRDGPPEPDEGEVEVLGPGDAADMLDLMAEVYPGYFRPRTAEMGLYLGVREEGRLVAMAGQRMALDGWREISAVATRPEHRGRGLARRLVARLTAEILREGLVPFLHVDADNPIARAAYEKAGFALRRDLPLLRIRRG